MKPPKIQAERIVVTLLIAIAAIIPITGFYYSYQEKKLANTPIDVLKNWSLTVDASKTYHPGDVVQVEGKFTKLINVKGDSHRFVQCHKSDGGWDAKVEANNTQASTLPVKNGKSSYNVGIPFTPGALPNQCRICVEVTYNVNKYHPKFLESQCSNEFPVEQRPGVVDLNDGQTYIYTDNLQNSQKTNSSIYEPSTGQQPIIIYRNDSTSPGTETSPPTVQKSPTILDRVDNLLNKIGL